MANFVTIFLKLTSSTSYIFQEIYIKPTLTLIAYPDTVSNIKDMLNTLILSQTTDMDEIAKKKFLGF